MINLIHAHSLSVESARLTTHNMHELGTQEAYIEAITINDTVTREEFKKLESPLQPKDVERITRESIFWLQHLTWIHRAAEPRTQEKPI